ncbi:Phage integrase [Azospirillum argentinense]|uniref:tyrosine-type recombinase/integrase n=1 Tax=Azospirillum argentinense TaxID=2970906 RepID=UPI0032E030F4
MAERITDKLVRGITPPPKANKITYDDEVKGFGIRVTAAGSKAFILNYTIHGRERRYTIGDYPTWSVAAARDEAKELRKRIDRGEDPLAKRIEDREAPTILDLWKRYEEVHLPRKRKRSGDDDRSMWTNYILPRFRSVKVADLTAEDVDRMHREIGADKPVRANRVVEVLRKALNLAERWEWIKKNPATGVKRYVEQGRVRYLTKQELRFLSEAFDRHPQQTSCNAIRLLLLTGARKMEVLSARWNMFDFEAGIWTKPSSHTKQNKPHRVPLSQPALALLAAIRDAKDADPVFVFPGEGEGGHMVDVKRTWLGLRDTVTLRLWMEDRTARPLIERLANTLERQPTVAEVEETAKRGNVTLPTAMRDVHMHDLRHTFASLIASAGMGLPIIGALLGHTQAATTQRYIHLYDNPLRKAADAASQGVVGEQMEFSE